MICSRDMERRGEEKRGGKGKRWEEGRTAVQSGDYSFDLM